MVILTMTILMINGCTTTYGPNGPSHLGGYSEMRVAEDTYDVSFSNNGITVDTFAYDSALLRAAEVTIENGYTYFTVLETNQQTNQSSGITVHKVIKCFKNKPKTENLVYEAKLVERNMKRKYNINT